MQPAANAKPEDFVHQSLFSNHGTLSGPDTSMDHHNTVEYMKKGMSSCHPLLIWTEQRIMVGTHCGEDSLVFWYSAFKLSEYFNLFSDIYIVDVFIHFTLNCFLINYFTCFILYISPHTQVGSCSDFEKLEEISTILFLMAKRFLFSSIVNFSLVGSK